MSHWNFRLVDLSDENNNSPWLELQEVYYDDQGDPVGYCDPCMGSETVEGMRELLSWYALALRRPILKKADLIGEFIRDDEDDETPEGNT